MGNGAFEMCVDSGYKGPLTRRTAVSVGTADHNLVPIDILSDDLDRNLVASVQPQCRALAHRSQSGTPRFNEAAMELRGALRT